MGLQDIIDWYEQYSKKQRQEVCCGVWPFQIPGRFDPFLSCCIPHDEAYQKSEVLYARGVVENNDDLKHEALAVKALADSQFCEAINLRIAAGSALARPVLRVWGKTYISLVMHNSNKFWFGSIGAKIASFESGETPTVQLALRRSGYAGKETLMQEEKWGL